MITPYNNEQLNNDFRARQGFNNYFFSGVNLPTNNNLKTAIMQGVNLA